MTSKHTWRLLSLTLLGALSSASVLAQDAGYYYVGAGAGSSHGKLRDDRMSSALGQGFTVSNATDDSTDIAFKGFAGYQFNRYIGVEAGYFSLGEFTFDADTNPAGTVHGRAKANGLNLDLVGTLPLTDYLHVIGRIGVHNAKTTNTFSTTGAAVVVSSTTDKRETNYKAGLGLAYEFSPSMQIRAEIERYRVNDALSHHADVDMVSLSLVFPFGKSPSYAQAGSMR